jgi:hypothetical protein
VRQINFTFLSPTQTSQSCVVYKIADTAFHSNATIPELGHLIELNNIQIYSNTKTQSNCTFQIYSDTCSIGEYKYKLNISSNNISCYHIKHKQDSYLINKNSIDLHIENIDIHLLIGPILILNLALNNTFCLHASAFLLNEKIFILMANSGTGKSTIARYIEEKSKGVRIADDIVPIEIRNNKITVLPDFPQLKLPTEQQYQGKPLQKKVILLFARKTLKQTKTHQIDTFVALKKIIKHSVATKLFAPQELKNHLDFCFQVSQKAIAYQIEYAHSESSLKDIMREINAIT